LLAVARRRCRRAVAEIRIDIGTSRQERKFWETEEVRRRAAAGENDEKDDKKAMRGPGSTV